MKMIALLGAAALAVGGIAAAPAAAQYHHGYGHGYHGGGHGFRGHYRGGYGYHRGWRGYHHRRVVCGRFGRCHRI